MPNTSLISAEFIADISGHVIIAVDYDGKVLYFNRKAACIFTDIAEGVFLCSYLSGDDKILIKHHIDVAFYQQRNLDFYWNYKKRFYLIEAHIYQQFLWLVFKDISELRQLTHQLNFGIYQNNQMEVLGNLGYWQLNIKQKQFYWSDGMYRLLNIPKSAVPYYGSVLRRFMMVDDFNFYKQKLKSLLQNQSEEFYGQLRLIMADKTIKNCYVIAHRDYFNGMDVITGILQENNKQNNYNVSSSMETAQIIHDIKHHLQALSAIKIDDEFNKNMQSLKEYHISKVKNLINNITIVSHSNIDNKLVNIAHLLSDLCAEYKMSEYNHQVKIICRINKVYIKTNEYELSRIVGNLLANALKFARSKIILGNDRNHIWIADDGVGIPYEEQKRIFDAFYQTDNSILRGTQGEGLGLYTVNKLCQKLNIRLSLKSKLQCYSIFKLHFD